ncbi:hypothetical protein DAEQUDRAFT_762995 [Daedalea quercina L-15889]|uniref:Uncharacterized protein n=1 Tax=Daedalea quercina L-15889 TaxID=1314783 RepID=A0A165SNC2_9APHY|nr:hypothetical protein DAEQUDRAFT_762995 [Daedalea quercina L-15889]
MATQPGSPENTRHSPNGSNSDQNNTVQNGESYKPGNIRVDTGAVPAVRTWTQADRHAADTQMRTQAMEELMKSWMDRLKLITVITTFFAATEAQMLGITTPSDDDIHKTSVWPIAQRVANTSFASALVIHLCAAIISFLAAFFLVRHRLKEASKEEMEAEMKAEAHAAGGDKPSEHSTRLISANPHVVEMGPFHHGEPPTRLVQLLHVLCMWFVVLGFAFALAGTEAYTWDRLSTGASAFVSACMGVCWLAAIATVMIACVRGLTSHGSASRYLPV